MVTTACRHSSSKPARSPMTKVPAGIKRNFIVSPLPRSISFSTVPAEDTSPTRERGPEVWESWPTLPSLTLRVTVTVAPSLALRASVAPAARPAPACRALAASGGSGQSGDQGLGRTGSRRLGSLVGRDDRQRKRVFVVVVDVGEELLVLHAVLDRRPAAGGGSSRQLAG